MRAGLLQRRIDKEKRKSKRSATKKKGGAGRWYQGLMLAWKGLSKDSNEKLIAETQANIVNY